MILRHYPRCLIRCNHHPAYPQYIEARRYYNNHCTGTNDFLKWSDPIDPYALCVITYSWRHIGVRVKFYNDKTYLCKNQSTDMERSPVR